MLLENGETSVGVDYLKACYDVSLKQHRLESKCFALRISSGGVPRDFIYQRNQKPQPHPRPKPAQAICESERKEILAQLNIVDTFRRHKARVVWQQGCPQRIFDYTESRPRSSRG